jgi:predicted  nucleic acid-binding Zn-ribbon protein
MAGRYAVAVAEPAEIEERLTSLESRVDAVETDAAASRHDLAATRHDAAAARHLAAAHDRDLADLGVKVDANRRAINALGVQTAARFDQLESEMRSGFAKSAAGHEQIVGLLNHVIARMDGE